MGAPVLSPEFRPQVKIVQDIRARPMRSRSLPTTWERDALGNYPRAIVQSIDPDGIERDPLTVL